MKLSRTDIKISSNKVDVPSQSPKIPLEKGTVISAKVVGVEGDSVRLLVAGSVINARNEGSSILFEGMRQDFEILSVREGEVLIRQISVGDETKAFNEDVLLLKTLQKLDVPANDKNVNILSSMMKQEAMISKSTFTSIKNDVSLLDKIISTIEKNGLGEKIAKANVSSNNSVSSDTTSSNPKPSITDATIYSLLSMGLKEVYSDKNALKLLSDLIVPKNEGHEDSEKNSLNSAVEKAPDDKSAVELIKAVKNTLPNSTRGTLEKVGGSVKQSAVEKNNLKLPFDNVFGTLKSLASDPAPLVLLSKNSVKPSLFNILFASTLLKDEFPFTELALNLIEKNPAAKTEVVHIARALIANLAKKNDISEAKIKEHIILNDLLKSELLSTSKPFSESTTEEKMLTSAYKSLHSITSEVETFIVPFFNGESITDVEIFVRDEERGANNAKSGDDKLIYLALNTKTMDRVKIKIDYKKTDLTVTFMVADEGVKNHLSNNIDRLNKKISLLVDKNIVFNVVSDNGEFALTDALSTESISSLRIDRLV